MSGLPGIFVRMERWPDPSRLRAKAWPEGHDSTLHGLGFRVWGLGFRVWGLEFGVF